MCGPSQIYSQLSNLTRRGHGKNVCLIFALIRENPRQWEAHGFLTWSLRSGVAAIPTSPVAPSILLRASQASAHVCNLFRGLLTGLKIKQAM